MKTFLILLTALGTATAAEQPERIDQAIQSKTVESAREQLVRIKPEKPNEITQGKLVYSGIAVQAVKAENKAQLLNPFAPEEYGSTDDNIVRDFKGNVSGLKIFAVGF